MLQRCPSVRLRAPCSRPASSSRLDSSIVVAEDMVFLAVLVGTPFAQLFRWRRSAPWEFVCKVDAPRSLRALFIAGEARGGVAGPLRARRRPAGRSVNIFQVNSAEKNPSSLIMRYVQTRIRIIIHKIDSHTHTESELGQQSCYPETNRCCRYHRCVC